MGEIKAIIYKEARNTGNGVAFFVPKALFDCKVLEKGKAYKVTIEELPVIPALFRRLGSRLFGFCHKIVRKSDSIYLAHSFLTKFHNSALRRLCSFHVQCVVPFLDNVIKKRVEVKSI